MSTPILRTCSRYCARTASGHAAEPPSSDMNVRLFIRSPGRRGASSVAGTLIESAIAVARLMTNSNLVGCTTGRSAGLAPLRMRPAYVPTRRWRLLGPINGDERRAFVWLVDRCHILGAAENCEARRLKRAGAIHPYH
jgi:hypothetical protein